MACHYNKQIEPEREPEPIATTIWLLDKQMNYGAWSYDVAQASIS